ncbi:MAG: PBSX family phage terminase large subunit, partial [Oscillospiraceae bacterium]
LGFVCEEKVSKGYIDISLGRQSNRYYLFSGKDEASASLIQGITLAGILLDEVALMPRSFVEQAVARCSVENAKLWFNCNPENPSHWFYKNWIKKAKEKKMAYLHFVMEDNPSLSDEVIARYHSLYSGAFHERFVLGKWAAAQGAVYPMFSPEKQVVETVPVCERYYLSCDYGTVNPTSIGLWGENEGKWYRIKEYYHASRVTGVLKTDEEYYMALEQLAEGFKIISVVVDPSAASFIECIRRHGKFNVIPAKNQVVSGIRTVGDMLKSGKILIHKSCAATINEFYLYSWDENAGQDVPIKENDHAMDEMRYLIMTIAMAQNDDSFFAIATERR